MYKVVVEIFYFLPPFHCFFTGKIRNIIESVANYLFSIFLVIPINN